MTTKTAKAPKATKQAATETVAPANPKCAIANVQVAKPQRKMLARIAAIGKHPGTALRKKRWGNYKVGMTLQDCKLGAGTDHKDVLFYTQHKGTDGKPLMTLRDATDEEYTKAVAAWEKSNTVAAEPQKKAA